MTISKPGIYDIPAEEYHSDPCPEPSLSSSIAKILVDETPRHAWTAHPRLNPDFEREEEDKFDLGTAAHSLMLNDPKKFAILRYEDFRKKEAQEAKADARRCGKLPILEKNWVRVNEMVDAARAQLSGASDFADIFTKGKPEQTLVWQEESDWFRIRLDWLYDDLAHPFDDYKTTGSADPDTWGRVVFSVRHDISAAFYRRGIRALGICRQPHMRFIVQEPRAPFCLSVIDFAPEIMELADRAVDMAIRKWRWCRTNNAWPGYPAKVVTITPPAWLENQRMERETRIADMAQRHKSDPDLLALGIKMQSPQ